MTIALLAHVNPKGYHSDFLFDSISAANVARRILGVPTKDISPEAFDVFCYWLNSGIVDCTDGDKSKARGKVLDKMIDVYVFADFHQSQIFRNAVLESLFLCYELIGTQEGDTIRKLLVDLMAGGTSLVRFSKASLTLLNNKFLLDYIVVFTKKKLVLGSSSGKAEVRSMRKGYWERYHGYPDDSPPTMTISEEEKNKKIFAPVGLPICPHLAKRLSPDKYGSIVSITAGSKMSDIIYVHEGLLRHYSSYFRTALKKEWVEGKSKKIALSEDDPTVVKAFFNWIFTGKLFGQLTPEGKIPLSQLEIIEIYVFGDVRGAPELCNAAIDLLYQKGMQDWAFPVDALQHVYDNTTDSSLLRKYLVDFAAEKFTFSHLRGNEAIYSKEFLIDLVEVFVSKQVKPAFLSTMSIGKYIHTKKLEICSKYHDHSTLEKWNNTW
ncbi:hypothetical protein G6011_02448 [Alternaria panax]|uniref:BTB domain-containing protein n=1 Tax=Alternaria panax TaxID=48097 RepID=A0AAD4FFQ4_9PLEO|nr:hypothetical protein G6011_02448 [Alternaria panax]